MFDFGPNKAYRYCWSWSALNRGVADVTPRPRLPQSLVYIGQKLYSTIVRGQYPPSSPELSSIRQSQQSSLAVQRSGV